MQNFGTFFSNFETFFSLLGSSYPSETLELGCYTSYELASPFWQNWQAHFSFFSKKRQKSKNAKFWKISKLNISKSIKPRLLKFDMCVHVGHMFVHAKFHDPDGHRTACMAKKKTNFGFFEHFLSIFWKKTVLKIQPGIQNFAWRSPWTLRTCMPNLVKLSQVVWPYRRHKGQGVQKCKILRPFFANFERFFRLFGLLYPPETLELGLYTY